MTPSLKISQKIIDRLSQEKTAHLGKVYGIVAKSNLIIVELQVAENPSIINSFPAEIYLCGVIQIGDGYYNEQSIKDNLDEVYVTDNPVFLNYEISTNEITANYYKNGQLEPTKFTQISEQEVLGQFLHTRLVASVPVTCELTVNSIKECFTNLRKNIASGAVAFGLNSSNIYLLAGDGENGIVGVSSNPTVGELYDDSDPGEGGGRKRKIQQYGVDVVRVDMLKQMTKENGVVGGKEHAPLCVLDKKNCKTLSLSVPIDALSVVHRQMKIANLYETIVESAVRNLRLVENSILEKLHESESGISQPEIYHFYPEDCGHFITKVYLKNDSDESLLSQRQKIHNELLLSQDRPLFRRSNSFVFKTKMEKNEPFLNPHIGLKPTDNGGKISLVKGKYTYYHYCQNKMDDNGWGCAYRSLQTLASWFKLQGYTEKDVPTFKDIQKCLVDIGDKPSNFIDSKQWIGSTEVNYVLNTLLGVTSKILYVSSGEEMANKGPELLNHFETYGSPVMIGGGVLAHTILGVDYNSQSGSLKFLILDPHYTGSEDLQIIQNKGWCGWKGVDFWDKTAYYNMCLPQVPKGI